MIPVEAKERAKDIRGRARRRSSLGIGVAAEVETARVQPVV